MCSSCKGVAVFILVIVNFLFALAGLLMLAFGVAAASQPDSIIKMLSYTGDLSQKANEAGFDVAGIMQSSAVFLIVLGAIVALVGLFGCIGACCSVQWMLTTYLIVLILVLLAEIALIIFAVFYPDKFKDQTQPLMKKSLDEKFKNDITLNSNGTITLPKGKEELAWSSMQFEVGCCGAYGPEDYKNNNFTRFYQTATVPVSCCKLADGPGKVPTSRTQFVDLDSCLSANPKTGSRNDLDCYSAIDVLLKNYGRIAIGIAVAIIGIEIILILLTIWICRSNTSGDRSKGV